MQAWHASCSQHPISSLCILKGGQQLIMPDVLALLIHCFIRSTHYLPTLICPRAGSGCWGGREAGDCTRSSISAAPVQGVVEGGLSKELLQLLFRKCCTVQFGMFSELKSRLLW